MSAAGTIAPPRPKITREPVIHPTAKLREATIEDYVEIHEAAQVSFSTIGAYSYLQEYVSVLLTDLGRFCAIAAMTRIGAPNHPYDRVTQHRFSYVPEYYWPGRTRDRAFFDARDAARVRVGNDVWMGHGAIVLPGVSIGDGAVIAAGAVVTKDVDPYVIVAGVPAKPIRRRFEAAVAERFAALAWWTWDHARLEAAVPDFQALSPEAFLEKYGG
jgi:phosphonate metabolism protein (transferase hexapeptide repeat family)